MAKDIGANPLTIGGTVANSIFNDGGKAFTATGTLNLSSGTYNVLNSGLPAFSSATCASGSTVNYALGGTQTIKGITYGNLTISGAGSNSKTAGGDITVKGVLNLSSANASSLKGCLDMSTFTLNMDVNSTTSGTGDVTGIVKRTNVAFANNTPYSFGNQFTTITFLGTSTAKPGWISCKITIGSAPSWKTGAIQRVYTIAQDGAGTDQVITNLHFLTSELNSNTASNLVFWDAHNGPTFDIIHNHGRSNNDLTNNWVGLSGFTLTYIAPPTSLDNKQWTLANNNVTKNTWSGADGTFPTRWDLATNWSGSPSHVPQTTEDVLIPGGLGTGRYPVLTLNVEVKTLEIESGATLTTGANTLTLNGYTGAYINNGTLTGTGGTVVFSHGTIGHVVSMSGSGTNSFNNLTVNANTYLQPATGCYLKIAGSVLTYTGTIIDLKATNNTVEYNGSGQNILNLQGPASDIGYANLVISGTSASLPATLNVMRDFTISSGTTAAAASTVAILGNVTLSGGTFNGSSSNISIAGNWINNGGTFTGGTSTVTFNSTTVAQAIQGSASNQTFNNITLDKTSQALSVGGSTTSLTVNNLNLTSGTFTAPTTLTVSGNTTHASGTFTPGTTTNFSGNLTNNGATFTATTGTVNFNNASLAQVIGGSESNIFNNLTITKTNPGYGVSSGANQTVNGILNLNSPNHSGSVGALDMGTYTLTMGASATTTGTGDVTGIVTRNSIVAGTSYSFGNQYTTLNFQAGGTLPSSVSARLVLATPSWMPVGTHVNRYYSFIQTGGNAATLVTLNLHYLSTELVGISDETTLDIYDHDSGGNDDHGKSNINITTKWVGLANESLTYLAPSPSNFDATYWTLGKREILSKTWVGGTSTLWSLDANWSDNTIPISTDNVVIPLVGTGKNNPTLDIPTEIQTLTIQSGGVLSGSSYTLTINGATGAWANLAGTTGFVPGSSTVKFTNAAATMADPTNFNNVTVDDGANLTLGTDNYMGISGTLSLSASGVLNAAGNHNTVEFNGTAQTIVNPNGAPSGFHNLTLSGNGTKVLPAELDIWGNFTNNFTGTINTNSVSVVFMGNTPQVIDGSASTSFLNFTVNNPIGVTLSKDEAVTGTITFLNGLITTGSNVLSIGSANNAGTVEGTGAGKYVNGNLIRYVPNGSAPSVTYDIGDVSNYTPVTIDFVGTTSGSGYFQVFTTPAQPPVASSLSQTKYVNRKWTITNGSVGGFTSFSPTFTFTSSDVMGNANTSNFVVAKYSGSAWSAFTSGTTTSTSTQCTGVNSFGDFYTGEPGSLTFQGTTPYYWSTPSNWPFNRVPSASDDVTIPSGMPVEITASTAATCNNITVSSGGSLTIVSDGTNSGSLIVNGTSTGNVTYNRYMVGGRWYIVSSPVNISQGIGSWLSDVSIPKNVSTNITNTTWYGMTSYIESTNTWGNYYTKDTSAVFKPGKGYLMRLLSTYSGTVPFTGNLITDATSRTIVRIGYGWNCVGNPFTSAISVNDAASQTSNFLALNAPVGNSQLDPNYGAIYVYNGTAYIPVNNTPNPGYNFIQAGQGFLVKSKTGGGSLTFTPEMRSAQVDQAFRSLAISEWNSLVLRASSGGNIRTTSINFRSDMTTGLDPTYDAGIFKSDPNFEIYSRLVDDNGVDFAIQSLPTDAWTSLSIPIGIDLPLGGDVTFSVNNSDIPSGYYPILNDILLNTSKYLKTIEDNYTVTIPASTMGPGRFFLTFGEGATTGTEVSITEPLRSLRIYPNPAADRINIQVEGFSGIIKIQIVNIQGVIVSERRNEVVGKERYSFEIASNTLQRGLYLVKAIYSDGTVKTEKLIISR